MTKLLKGKVPLETYRQIVQAVAQVDPHVYGGYIALLRRKCIFCGFDCSSYSEQDKMSWHEADCVYLKACALVRGQEDKA